MQYEAISPPGDGEGERLADGEGDLLGEGVGLGEGEGDGDGLGEREGEGLGEFVGALVGAGSGVPKTTKPVSSPAIETINASATRPRHPGNGSGKTRLPLFSRLSSWP
jgi:hypothetical protein